MQYDTGSHCVFYHRYLLLWSTKCFFQVLTDRLRLRVRDKGRAPCLGDVEENDLAAVRKAGAAPFEGIRKGPQRPPETVRKPAALQLPEPEVKFFAE